MRATKTPLARPRAGEGPGVRVGDPPTQAHAETKKKKFTQSRKDAKALSRIFDAAASHKLNGASRRRDRTSARSAIRSMPRHNRRHTTASLLASLRLCVKPSFLERWKATLTPNPSPAERQERGRVIHAGRMFWFTRNRFCGSYFFLISDRRLKFEPYVASTRPSFSSSIMKFT